MNDFLIPGRWFRARSGEIVGPMAENGATFIVRLNDGRAWAPDGRYLNAPGESALDLVEAIPTERVFDEMKARNRAARAARRAILRRSEVRCAARRLGLLDEARP